MILFDSAGRPLRRSIGFLSELRIERAPFEGLELVEGLEPVDAIGSDELELENDALENCLLCDSRSF